ncbi:hypothetical protein ACJX0J_019578, partial [Zea mays]
MQQQLQTYLLPLRGVQLRMNLQTCPQTYTIGLMNSQGFLRFFKGASRFIIYNIFFILYMCCELFTVRCHGQVLIIYFKQPEMQNRRSYPKHILKFTVFLVKINSVGRGASDRKRRDIFHEDEKHGEAYDFISCPITIYSYLKSLIVYRLFISCAGYVNILVCASVLVAYVNFI